MDYRWFSRTERRKALGFYAAALSIAVAVVLTSIHVTRLFDRTGETQLFTVVVQLNDFFRSGGLRYSWPLTTEKVAKWELPSDSWPQMLKPIYGSPVEIASISIGSDAYWIIRLTDLAAADCRKMIAAQRIYRSGMGFHSLSIQPKSTADEPLPTSVPTADNPVPSPSTCGRRNRLTYFFIAGGR